MENKKATLYCSEKIMKVQFNNEEHLINMLEGDLYDNWNCIVDSENRVWDFNFGWDEDDCDCKPSLWLIPVKKENGIMQTFYGSEEVFNVELVGTKVGYFKIYGTKEKKL